MTLREFIRANRSELARRIKKSLNFVPRQASCSCVLSGTDHFHDDAKEPDAEQIRQWILSDQGLYNWARSEGVRI